MADKHTSPEISSIACRLLGSDSIVNDPAVQDSLLKLGLRLGASRRACEEILIPELRAILDPFMSDVRSLAGSALAQDETDEG